MKKLTRFFSLTGSNSALFIILFLQDYTIFFTSQTATNYAVFAIIVETFGQ
jgi:hypothetical protein